MAAIPAAEVSDAAVWAHQPGVSVLMLTRNHAPYLQEAVSSVAAQRHGEPIELLIGDDSSSDGTLALAVTLQQRWPALVRVIHASEQVGIRDNFLRLLLRARAPLIAFLEGDDRWVCPDKLQLQCRHLRADRSLACVAGITLNRPPLSPAAGRLGLADLLRRYVAHSSALLFWRDLLIPFPNFPDGALDSMLLTVLATKGDCGWIDQPLSWYRRHSGGYWTGAPRMLRLERSVACIEAIDAYLFGRFRAELAAREIWIHRLEWPLPDRHPWQHWRSSWQILLRHGRRLLGRAPLGLLGLLLWTPLQPAGLVLRRWRRRLALGTRLRALQWSGIP